MQRLIPINGRQIPTGLISPHRAVRGLVTRSQYAGCR
jgi:hypothetical protein